VACKNGEIYLTIWPIWERGDGYAGLLVENHWKRDHLEDLGIDGIIILKCIFTKSVEVWNEFFWLRNRDKRRALTKAVMNPRFPSNMGIFLTPEEA
jgi:hypothetical protein